jgi:hypothetical protein
MQARSTSSWSRIPLVQLTDHRRRPAVPGGGATRTCRFNLRRPEEVRLGAAPLVPRQRRNRPPHTGAAIWDLVTGPLDQFGLGMDRAFGHSHRSVYEPHRVPTPEFA